MCLFINKLDVKLYLSELGYDHLNLRISSERFERLFTEILIFSREISYFSLLVKMSEPDDDDYDDRYSQCESPADIISYNPSHEITLTRQNNLLTSTAHSQTVLLSNVVVATAHDSMERRILQPGRYIDPLLTSSFTITSALKGPDDKFLSLKGSITIKGVTSNMLIRRIIAIPSEELYNCHY